MKKILLLIVTAILITLITPTRALIDLNVHKGEVWSEQTLIAPFDIPMFKSEQVLEQEREDVQANFRPIFRIDTTILNNKISRMMAINDTVAELLNKMYITGVMPESEWNKYKDKIVRLSNGNILTTIPASELYTPSQVIGALSDRGLASTQLNEKIVSNLRYDDKINKQVLSDELKNISTTRSMVRDGEVIVSSGQIIDDNTLQKLKSFNLEYETQVGISGNIYYLMLGRFLIIVILLLVNYIFFTSFANHYFGTGTRQWVFIMMLYLLMSTIVSVAAHLDGVSPYIAPLPIVSIYLMNYFNMRVAIFGNISVAIIGALFVRIPFDFFLVNFIAGMVAIFMMRHHYHRNNLFQAIGALFVAQVLCYISVSLLRQANIETINYTTILWFTANVFLILGLYQAVYLIERTFGFVSDITLLELCDTNQPLLLQLAEKAPGTFQHSVQVANLAEAAAKEIGANPLLARTGAMYHDIGKMENPFYFVENLTGVFNPHEDIEPIESAAIIRRHVTDGIAIARKNRLPNQIAEFISGHHGTSKMYYFYAAQMKKEVMADVDLFSYPGPKPIGKEVAICMMADAVEAASRSLKSYEKESLEALVDKIVDIQIAEHQLSDSELSFSEVQQIKALFKAKLNTIYHVRISYPERPKQEKLR